MELVLTDREQFAVRQLLQAEPEPGADVLPRAALGALARLIPCDTIGSGDAAVGGQQDFSGDILYVAFPKSDGAVARVCLTRRRPFSAREVALLAMLEPALGRLVRSRPRLTACSTLSGAEQRVLELVACGGSNQDVAEQLYITVATVRKHLEHAYRKLGVTNRTAAVAALVDARGASRTPTNIRLSADPLAVHVIAH